jgi:hypothetical protein
MIGYLAPHRRAKPSASITKPASSVYPIYYLNLIRRLGKRQAASFI